MPTSRKVVTCLAIVVSIALVMPGGCRRYVASPPPRSPGAREPIPRQAAGSESRADRIDTALARAAKFLIAAQSPDGAWRSDVYAPFREGDALTPLVVATLIALPDAEAQGAAIDRGAEYLVRIGLGERQPELAYPVYTAACAVMALANRDAERAKQARAVWLARLRELQLAEPLGWQTDDSFYGGWGYAARPPRKPAAGTPLAPLAEPNLSATVFALEALRAAGVGPDDASVQKALSFVRRCQNHAEDPAAADAQFADGGFFFIQGDDVRNKAGVAGTDSAGNTRFASYGSATADGLRAMLLCGRTGDDPRVAAAWRWLPAHFSAVAHPGAYVPEREAARAAVYFYYCRSLARLLADGELDTLAHERDRAHMAQALAEALVARQESDGSWRNAAVDVREDDPLVATCLAAAALADCRRAMAFEKTD
ncbi:MAG: hypothetical protein HYX69_02790 [Planctomycetia bacterium]|nr:hypothetical protein [Planctomycetia bacterium]